MTKEVDVDAYNPYVAAVRVVPHHRGIECTVAEAAGLLGKIMTPSPDNPKQATTG